MGDFSDRDQFKASLPRFDNFQRSLTLPEIDDLLADKYLIPDDSQFDEYLRWPMDDEASLNIITESLNYTLDNLGFLQPERYRAGVELIASHLAIFSDIRVGDIFYFMKDFFHGSTSSSYNQKFFSDAAAYVFLHKIYIELACRDHD
jgi:hypothetical protein